MLMFLTVMDVFKERAIGIFVMRSANTKPDAQLLVLIRRIVVQT